MYKIVRVLNHNTVIATLDDDKEVSKVKISSEDENAMGKKIDVMSLAYNRLMNHVCYMIVEQ